MWVGRLRTGRRKKEGEEERNGTINLDKANKDKNLVE